MLLTELENYQDWTHSKAQKNMTQFDFISNMAMGLTESCEAIGGYKKHCFYGHGFDRKEFINKLGNLLFFLSETSAFFALNLADIWAEQSESVSFLDDYNGVDTKLYVKQNRVIDELSAINLYAALILRWMRINNRIDGYVEDNGKLYGEIMVCLYGIVDGLQGILHLLDIGITEVVEANIEKLNTRYPNGFNPADSIARIDEKRKATVKDENHGDGLSSISIYIGDGDGEIRFMLYNPSKQGDREMAVKAAMDKAAELNLDIENLHQILD